MDIRVPHLAEGISSGTVVSVLVKEGDAVTKDQSVVELETEKAVAPVPSPGDGTVEKILVAEGDAVSVGQVIIKLAGQAGSAQAPSVSKPAETLEQPQATAPPPQSAARPQAPVVNKVPPPGFPPPASPTIRKIARELGIDLSRISGSEHGGRITMLDLRDYIHMLQEAYVSAQDQPSAAGGPRVQPVTIDFSKFGPVKREPMSTLRKKIAEKMGESWAAIPHVTQFDEADITSLMKLRKKYVDDYSKAGVRLTITGIILRGLVQVLQKYPLFNASIDEAKNEIVYKDYIHLGIAVDTEQGLIVPVLKDAHKKDLVQLSVGLQELAEKTRERKVSIEDLQGSSFTVSNQGGIGGAHFTPIVNRPDAAILGLGQTREKAIVRSGKVVIGSMLPLGLSYDHRLIDGAHAARFISELVDILENFPEEEITRGLQSNKTKKPETKRKKK